ncbi:protein sel-1 2-like [Pyrus ussuriensis x Pyrus communis]|uniref:Protein sel-1 2-like n=1 Tax=Pyrus ussuriensis x Pyrus communis TaxID=2448454 RepID=A0A5N5HNC1_9ROSA|nr:protein sel-1 2-like [Pyrus ussuriensis x Pyrus communis]
MPGARVMHLLDLQNVVVHGCSVRVDGWVKLEGAVFEDWVLGARVKLFIGLRDMLGKWMVIGDGGGAEGRSVVRK